VRRKEKTMIWKPSAFRYDTIKLNFWDIIKLLFGFTIGDGACKIKLWGKSKSI